MPGVYLSYPFCAQKCTYCNFASGVFPRELEAKYLDTLLAELRAVKWRWMPETVYLGGGTPSQMDTAALAGLLNEIPGRVWREATMEAAPGGITADRAATWVRSGINRVSLGVQSFVARELARTGRKHTADVVHREVAILRDAGISNINIDLISGLPGQTRASWEESLAWVERIGAPHVSVYMLEVDEDSRLGREKLLGGVRYGAGNMPSEGETADMYEVAVDRLEELGIPRYEISNFARPGFESTHNLKYWRLEPYVGFGADAHSFDGALRWQNVESPVDYVERASASALTQPANLMEEKFFVGLRLSAGIRPTPQEWRRFESPIRRFVHDGLLEATADTLRLTRRGVLLSNEVFQEFINL